MIDDVRVIQGGGKMECINIRIDVFVAVAFCCNRLNMKIQIENRNMVFFKECIDILHRLSSVDKPDFNTLEGFDRDDSLKDHQDTEYEQTADDAHPIVSIAGCQSETGGIPHGSSCGQSADLSIRHKDRACAKKADATDNLCRHASKIVSDMDIGCIVYIMHEKAFYQCDRAGAHADQYMCTESGRAILVFPFYPHDASGKNGNKNPNNQFQRRKRTGIDQMMKHRVSLPEKRISVVIRLELKIYYLLQCSIVKDYFLGKREGENVHEEVEIDEKTLHRLKSICYNHKDSRPVRSFSRIERACEKEIMRHVFWDNAFQFDNRTSENAV